MKTYEDGLNEAWEAARKVMDMNPYELGKLIGVDTTFESDVINKYSASEVIAKIEEYEENQKQTNDKIIHVGDEIYSELTDSKAVVQRIDIWHRYQCFTDEGAQVIIDKQTFNDYWVKTGKNYPQIEEVLKQMKENKDE